MTFQKKRPEDRKVKERKPPRPIKPWNKPALAAIEVGKPLIFTVRGNDTKIMRAVRKAASVTGEEHAIKLSVSLVGSTYTISRTA